MAATMSDEPIVGAGFRTSPRAAQFTLWLGVVFALLANWLEWPNWVLISSIASAAYGAGVHDGYRWARQQRWMEWMAEHRDPEWVKQIDPKWFECKE